MALGRVISQPVPATGFAILAMVLVFTTSTDLYVTTLPMVRDAFDVSRTAVEATLPLNFAGFAMGTLVHGVASDRFGRRPVLLANLVIFLLASLLCALAPSITWLALGRVVQGFSAAAGTVLVTLVLRELFEPVTARKWVSAYSGAIAIGPSVAPFLGALIAEAFGWRVNFALLAVCAGLVALWVSWTVPEPRRAGPRYGDARARVAQISTLCRNRAFVGYSLIGAASLAGIFAFITGAPFLFIEDLGFRPTTYGLIQGGLAFCYVLGVVINSVLSGRMAPRRILRFGMVFALTGIVVLWSVVTREVLVPGGIVLSIAMCTFGLGLQMSNAWYLTYEHIDKADYAMGGTLSGGLEWALVALLSALVVTIAATPVLVLATILSVCAALIAVCYLWTRNL